MMVVNGVQTGMMTKMNGGKFWNGFAIGATTTGVTMGGSQLLGGLNVAGMIPNGALHGGINVGVNGVSNLIAGNKFFDGWGYSAGTGFARGAYSGYQLSKQGGRNYWWGSKVHKDRSPWSFNPAEKPIYSFDFGLINGDNRNVRNDCGPATVLEADRYYGKNKSFRDIAREVDYTENVGTPTLKVKQELERSYGEQWIDGKNIMNPDYIKEIHQNRNLISILGERLDPNNLSADHWDNIRRIDFYSDKIIIKLRIGTYTLDGSFMDKHKPMFFRTFGR